MGVSKICAFPQQIDRSALLPISYPTESRRSHGRVAIAKSPCLLGYRVAGMNRFVC